MSIIDRDLKGNRIESTAKESRSQEIDGDNRFCGHRFVLKQRLYGDKRCLYCGVWFHWQSSENNVNRWIRTNNLDKLNKDTNIEPLHCESLHCQEYHELCRRADLKRQQDYQEGLDQKYLKVYKNLKRAKLL